MGKNRSANCSLKQIFNKHCCAKCYTSNNPNVANYYQHNSASLDRPVSIRECMRLASITNFSSKNIMCEMTYKLQKILMICHVTSSKIWKVLELLKEFKIDICCMTET